VLLLDRPAGAVLPCQSDQLHAVFRFITRFGVSTGYLVGAAVTFVALRVASRLNRFAALAARSRPIPPCPSSSHGHRRLGARRRSRQDRIRPRPTQAVVQATATIISPGGARSRISGLPVRPHRQRRRHRPRLQHDLARYRALAALFAALVAASRIIITAHYVSDVVMGASSPSRSCLYPLRLRAKRHRTRTPRAPRRPIRGTRCRGARGSARPPRL